MSERQNTRNQLPGCGMARGKPWGKVGTTNSSASSTWDTGASACASSERSVRSGVGPEERVGNGATGNGDSCVQQVGAPHPPLALPCSGHGASNARRCDINERPCYFFPGKTRGCGAWPPRVRGTYKRMNTCSVLVPGWPGDDARLLARTKIPASEPAAAPQAWCVKLKRSPEERGRGLGWQAPA